MLRSVNLKSIFFLKLHCPKNEQVKFMYSEKAAQFCEIFTLFLSYVVPVKSKVKISQNFVAFSEYMNFTRQNSALEFKKWLNQHLKAPISH